MNQSLQYEVNAVMPAVAATGLMNATVTIKQRLNTINSMGQADMSNADYQPIAGLTNLTGMISVDHLIAPDAAGVERLTAQFNTREDRHLLLGDYYPQIQQQNLAEVTLINPDTGLPITIDYEIMAVESDSEQQMTRLAVRFFSL